MKNVIIIGSGFMATAIAKSISHSGIKPGILNLADPDGAEKLASDVGGYTAQPSDLNTAEMTVLGFKPQNFSVAAQQYGQEISSSATVVSIMAGVKIADIEKALKPGTPVIRVMPNLAVSVSKGVCGYCTNSAVTDSAADDFEKLFSDMGKTVRLEEKYLSAVTALSGSGPAYFYYLCKYMTEAGVKLGLDREDAETLVRGTLSGSAALIENDPDVSFDEMLRRITSKKGTTEAALNAFDTAQSDEIIENAVNAAFGRSEELSLEVSESLR